MLGLVLAAALLLGHAGHPLAAPPQPSRTALIVLENRSYEQVIGNPAAPYLNSLAARGALATRYFAITHPSLPNYVAMTTGGHAEITGDCANCDSAAPSLANQLDAAGVSWRAYFEGLPREIASPYSKASPYNRYYNPFVYSDTLPGADLTGHLGNFARLHGDLATGLLPTFAWIAPSTLHDGHHHPLAAADRYAKRLVPKLLHALGPHGLLLITWDEGQPTDKRGGGGRVPLIAVGPAAARRVHVSKRADHYALLRTIEHRLKLKPLGHARTAPRLDALLSRPPTN